MNSSPTVSVLMPVYNAAAYLSEAVVSVLNQTYVDFELIIVNDGSTDNSLNVLSTFSKDARLRIINNEKNMGLIHSLNMGLSECKGEFIARMDADDICDLRRLERQMQFLINNKSIDIIGGAIRFFGKIRAPYTFQYPPNHDEINASMLFFCPLAHPAIMFRRHLVDAGLMYFDKKYQHAEDYQLWTRLLAKVRAANLSELVLHYRLHASQISSGQSSQQYQLSSQIRKELLLLAGVQWTESELALHEQVILEKPFLKAQDLENLARWFEKIENSNVQSGYWNSDALRTVFKKYFIKAASNTPYWMAVDLLLSPTTKKYLDLTDVAKLNSLSAKIRRLFKIAKYHLIAE